MKTLLFLSIATAAAFLISLISLLFGAGKKHKGLLLLSLFFFIASLILGAFLMQGIWIKGKNQLHEMTRKRSGQEIYIALMGEGQSNCVNVLRYRDQVVPKFDVAIWLEFTTCQAEMDRLLAAHPYTSMVVATQMFQRETLSGEPTDWFHPENLGDSIRVFEYISDDSRNVQTMWCTTDSTHVFLRDMYD